MNTERTVNGRDLVRDRARRLVADFPPAETGATEFLGAQFDAGLAFVHFPEGHGGLGLPRELQQPVTELLRSAGAPDPADRNPIGHGMAAPTLLEQGTEEQKRKYLRRIFTCEDIWCQLFSEPSAGSDVASLATRARRDGADWVIDGQKVWTTFAHVARYGLLLARTDPEAEKHRGLTYFVLDMSAPGVDVRPLRQLTGDAEFNEVFLTGARVPDTERLSEVGEGWRAALVTLMNERVSIGGAAPPRSSGPIGAALDVWARSGRDPVYRDRLAGLWIEAEVLRLTNMRAAATARRGVPGPEGSTAKLSHAELSQRIYEFCVDLLGPVGTLYPSYEERRPNLAGIAYADVRQGFLRARANSIEGGTSEIMRNILGERVLGLAGDVRADKGRPWSEVPRG